MKRLLVLVSVLALVLLPVGCMDIEGVIRGMVRDLVEDLASTYTLRVSGAVGHNFTGQYQVVTAEYDAETWADFSTESVSIEGQIVGDHVEYIIDDAVSVAAMVQKGGGDETLLRVELWRGAELVESSETAAPWGAVLVVGFAD